MTRPSTLLATLEDELVLAAGVTVRTIRARRRGLAEVALMLGIAAEIWIGALRTAALHVQP